MLITTSITFGIDWHDYSLIMRISMQIPFIDTWGEKTESVPLTETLTQAETVKLTVTIIIVNKH